MRGKRSKQYRKLLQQYSMAFGFREPYQILVDAKMIQDSYRFSMDLVASLELITQCSIRHLYTLKDISQSQKDTLIDIAKHMERRRCNHHTLDEPLSTLECLSGVIDPKRSFTNKNRYVVASQEEEVRRHCRGIKGVPLVYVKRSVMVMEPMSEGSADVREGIEKSKFRSGLRGRGTGSLGKRKREDGNEDDFEIPKTNEEMTAAEENKKEIKKRKARGPKGPNPLSVKKPKQEIGGAQGGDDGQRSKRIRIDASELAVPAVDIVEGMLDETRNPPAKRKRKRKHKTSRLDGFAAMINADNEAEE
ncbi:U3 small nucleolar RNA-associated protein 23, partial [Lecanoromycetidae sp. Uapishka_2]